MKRAVGRRAYVPRLSRARHPWAGDHSIRGTRLASGDLGRARRTLVKASGRHILILVIKNGDFLDRAKIDI